jgi:membrane associated rhomboid family serine protease
MFLHGGWLHIAFNMWTLFIFGDNIEDRMGPLRFTAFYLLCGVLASAAHIALAPGSVTPTIGASGAIAGVLGAYLLLYPRGLVIVLVPILIFPFFFAVPAFLYLGLWVLLQFFSGVASLADSGAGGVAWWAHLGGFVAGIVLHRAFLSRRGYGRKAERDEYGDLAGWFD